MSHPSSSFFLMCLSTTVYIIHISFICLHVILTLHWPSVFLISVRGQENGLDGTKSGGPSGRGTERGRRGRGRGRGDQFVRGMGIGGRVLLLVL